MTDIPALVAELRRVAAELRVEVTYDSTIHDVDRQAVALNNAAAMLSRAADALSALAKELEEARTRALKAERDLQDITAIGHSFADMNDKALAALKASEAREGELRTDRDSWRRVAERLEEEKQALRAALEAAVRVMSCAAGSIESGQVADKEPDKMLRRGIVYANAVLAAKEMGS